MPLVFTDPKSLRHLTQDVCSTRKSHTLQEVQYGECEDKLLLKREFPWLPLRKVLACCSTS